MEDVAIKVQNVHKDFKLPHQKTGSIKSIVTSRLGHKSSFELQHALKGIDIEIKKGEFFGIVGRNGSGKSTLLKILAGIYQPTKGSVQVNGKLVPFIELGVGFNPELTGRENVYLNGALLGFSEKEVTAMYDDIVEFAELEKFMDQKLKNYSSGMQVRLAFSMATRSNADILLIDEVLAVGDADFQRKCFNYFKTLKNDEKTVVFVSHDMDAVREYCDRAILVDASKIIAAGDTRSVAESYLKLFTNSFSTARSSGSKWGSGAVATEDIALELTDKKIVLKHTIVANEAVDHPIVGLRIRDASGADILGTNNKIEEVRTPKLAAGEKLLITWELPNVLSDGTYKVDPAVLHEDGITVLEWWDGAQEFTVIKERRLPYNIDPGFKLKLEHDRS